MHTLPLCFVPSQGSMLVGIMQAVSLEGIAHQTGRQRGGLPQLP